ncbi:fumarylacetoacetate hydrolase [Candidatus Pelagibacter sp.]|nr:fumarylacetoacetate hydrolase [Candidatus Pelagibacter sp.]
MFSKKIFKKINILSSSLAGARKQNILIQPLPAYITKNLNLAQQIRSFAEAKLEWNPVGFKIGATNKKIMKLLKAKEPFYSYLFKEQTFSNKKLLKLTPQILGIELEIAYKISKKIFDTRICKKKELKNYIYGVAPAIELVGYRQKIKKIKYVGQAIVDFGLNISFVKSKIYKTKNILNLSLKTKVTNLKNKKIYFGHTKNVMGNPINALFWLINDLKKRNVSLDKDFWVTTGSTTSIIPVKKGDNFLGEILPIGKVNVSF